MGVTSESKHPYLKITTLETLDGAMNTYFEVLRQTKERRGITTSGIEMSNTFLPSDSFKLVTVLYLLVPMVFQSPSPNQGHSTRTHITNWDILPSAMNKIQCIYPCSSCQGRVILPNTVVITDVECGM